MKKLTMLFKQGTSLLMATVLMFGSAIPALAEETEPMDEAVGEEIFLEDTGESDATDEIILEDNEEPVMDDNAEIDSQDLVEESSDVSANRQDEEDSLIGDPEEKSKEDEEIQLVIEDEDTMEAETLEASYAGLSAPRIVKAESLSGQAVTWDCIFFGSYPQAEVVSNANYEAMSKLSRLKGDVIVDSALYTRLKKASWTDNTTVIDGNKYQRLQDSDAVEMRGYPNYYEWSKDPVTYHYFKYEPIKWRVLSVSGSTALVVADKVLDYQYYNDTSKDVTWETCSLRKWLNGTFMNRAFSSSEKNVITSTTLKNSKGRWTGTPGGNDTVDKVFLLAESDVYSKDDDKTYTDGNSQQYGFAMNSRTYDEARRCQSSTFAKAMGSEWKDEIFTSAWLLRSPGYNSQEAVYVSSSGYVGQSGTWSAGVRPALNIDLTNTGVWSSAGTVCSTDDVQLEYEPLKMSDLDQKLTLTKTGVNVQWHSIDKATKYLVYKGFVDNMKVIQTVKETGKDVYEINDNDVVPGKKCWYVVHAVDSSGIEYGFGINENWKAEGIPAVYYPELFVLYITKPIVTVSSCEAGNKITWNDPNGVAIGYILSRREKDSDVWEKLIDTTDTEYIDTTIDTDQRYFYSVQSYCNKNNADAIEYSWFDPMGVSLPCENDQHVYQEQTTPATSKQDGIITAVCENCGAYKENVIPSIKSATLEYQSVTYSGGYQRPTVTVKDLKGNKISSKYYTVKYTDSKKVGQATATITFKNKYAGTITRNYKILPKGTAIASLGRGSKSITVKLKKQTVQTTGYQIRYSTSSKMTNAKIVTLSKNTILSKKITKLKGKKKYYVQVRTYKTVSGKKYCSAWSAKKYITTKA